MKNILAAFILLIFLLVVLNSCSKTETAPVLDTGNYIFDKLDDYSTVRLFTKNGEINDQSLISKYKTQYSQFIYPLQNQSFRSDTINILNMSQARLNGRIYSFTKIDNIYEFKGTDTTYYTGTIDSLFYALGKYKPYYSILFFNPFTNESLISTLQYYYVSFSNDRLIFHAVNILQFSTQYYQGTLVSSDFRRGNIFNFFDPSGINKLRTRDTLLIQTYNIHSKKIN